MGTLTDPAARLWSRSAGSSLSRSFARHRAILARLTILDALFGGGSFPRVPFSGLERCPGSSAQAVPSHYSWPISLRALTSAPSCATRARRSLPTTPAGTSGAVFTLKIGSLLPLGPTPFAIGS
jgi:hypothetical protein